MVQRRRVPAARLDALAGQQLGHGVRVLHQHRERRIDALRWPHLVCDHTIQPLAVGRIQRLTPSNRLRPAIQRRQRDRRVVLGQLRVRPNLGDDAVRVLALVEPEAGQPPHSFQQLRRAADHAALASRKGLRRMQAIDPHAVRLIAPRARGVDQRAAGHRHAERADVERLPLLRVDQPPVRPHIAQQRLESGAHNRRGRRGERERRHPHLVSPVEQALRRQLKPERGRRHRHAAHPPLKLLNQRPAVAVPPRLVNETQIWEDFVGSRYVRNQNLKRHCEPSPLRPSGAPSLWLRLPSHCLGGTCRNRRDRASSTSDRPSPSGQPTASRRYPASVY